MSVWEYNNGTTDDMPGDQTYGNDAYGFGLYPGGAQAGSPYLTATFGEQVDHVLSSPDLSPRT